MEPAVIIISGAPGSGKTAAAMFFRNRRIPTVRMGDITLSEIARRNMPQGWESEKKVWKDMRKSLGDDIFARAAFEKLKSSGGGKHKLAVIEGMRTMAEYDFFRKVFPEVKTVFIRCSDEKRYERLKKRKVRPLTVYQAKKRDRDEGESFQLDSIRRKADFIVINDDGVEDLYNNLANTLRKYL